MVLNGKPLQDYLVNPCDPQGSILVPKLFLLHFDDLPDDACCNIVLCGYDTTHYSNCDWNSAFWQELELAF